MISNVGYGRAEMTNLIKTPIKRLLFLLMPQVHWHKAVAIIRANQLTRRRLAPLLFLLFFCSLLGVLLDGAGLILLVELIAGEFNLASETAQNRLVAWLLDLLPIARTVVPVYLVVLCLFALRALALFSSSLFDGIIQAKTRQVIQKNGMVALLNGDWEILRDLRVGGKVGAITEESLHVAQFFMAILRILQGLLLATILSLMAIWVSLPSAVIFIVIGIPVALILKSIFAKQSRLSQQLISLRQNYYASVTERLSGLFQLKADNRLGTHLTKTITDQHDLTKLEIRIWLMRAWTVLTNAMIPALVLLLFWLASLLTGKPLSNLLYLLAGVGALGLRVLSYVNLISANISNLTAVSGSLSPVYEVLTIPRQTNKTEPPEQIVSINAFDLSYAFDLRPVFERINIGTELAKPLIIKGSSGSGKTTLANLLAGLYEPSEGSVVYQGKSGASYNSLKYRPRVGYVTQDIHLFHDTIRSNLLPLDSAVSDEVLKELLGSINAWRFIESRGGLDTILSEGGRSLSGGERRRIGIARAMLRQPDILILDEVTSGLDNETKQELKHVVDQLARSMIVVAITHEPLYFSNHILFNMPD